MAKKQRKKSLKGKTKGEVLYEYLVKKGQEFSKHLREHSTPWEKSLYKTLKDLHYKFEFQVPVIVPVGKSFRLYIVDFLLTDFNIFIEADGKFHHTKENQKKDNLRTKHLSKIGYIPLRLTNSQISVYTKEQINDIIQTKLKMLNPSN